MSTVTVETAFDFRRVTKALKAALKVAAEATTPSEVSNPLRPSLRDQAPAAPSATGQVIYRDHFIVIGRTAQDYCVAFPDGCVRYGAMADIKGDIDAWFTGALPGL